MSITIKRPVEKKKLSQTVAEELEQLIRQGEFAETGLLPSERELMDLFAVGRPSIRDALSALSRKGLVKTSSGERTRVTQPSAETIFSELSGITKDFLLQPMGIQYVDQLREFFESSLVRYAAQAATDEQIQELAVALELNRQSVNNESQFKKTDTNFHRIIATIPGNPIFVAIHQALVDWVIDARTSPSEASSKALNVRSYEDHLRIFHAIKARDAQAAERALSSHIQYVFDHFHGQR